MMKRLKNNVILVFLSVVFASLFLFSSEIKASVLDSTGLWLNKLVPSMFPLYVVLDMFINYGIVKVLFRAFKSNTPIVAFISLVGGTPGNAKYIKEFYQNGYFSKDQGEYLLTFAYSPNPLFIFAICNNVRASLFVLAIIYFTNFINFIIFRCKFKDRWSKLVKTEEKTFSHVLEESIGRSSKVLILILGIVVTYGILNTLLSKFGLDSVFLSSLLEMTNALAIIKDGGYNIFWLLFACLFSGLSIHTQVKSILEGTDLSYWPFLLGRIVAAVPFLILAVFY